MTTKERNALQTLFNKIDEMNKVRYETLKNLQDLNIEHGDGHRWCSWKGCLDGVLQANSDGIWRGRAEYQYERFMKAEGAYDMLMELGQTLADLGFWKNERR